MSSMSSFLPYPLTESRIGRTTGAALAIEQFAAEQKTLLAAERMSEHYVQFYEEDGFLIEEVLGFIGTGLWAGDAGVVIASQSHLDQLAERLRQNGLSEGAKPSYAGRYVAVDADEMLERIMIDDWPDERRFIDFASAIVEDAARDGRVRVRVFCGLVASLCAAGKQNAAIRIEELWERLCQLQPFSLLCAYPMSAFAKQEDGSSFHEVCSSHSHVCLAETFKLPTSQDELRRTIAILHQKANALESEVARRKEIERALQRREKELSDFLENAVEGMHRVGSDGRILWANKAELELLGYSAEEYIGHHIAEFHVDAEVIKDVLDKLLRGETLYDVPSRIRCKDGTIKHVLLHSNAQVKDGEFVSTRCLTRDVTDRVRLEQALNQKLQELADLDRRKNEFLAMLGHELRNPLAPIMTSLELMRQHSDNPEQLARCRETISRQAQLMTRLVEDLLDVSRITRGTISLKMQPVALADIVEQALEIAQPLIAERGHSLNLEMSTTPLWLRGDPARLSQVLANLLHNAAKYTDAGGRINLSAREVQGKLVLSVADNGVGLDAELCAKVFDLFVQGTDSLARARGGLGLGLTLVRSLVQLHGGSVEARSDGAGRGSEFVVTLPLGQAPEAAGSAPTDRLPAPSAGRKILIVDDNVDAAESLCELLRLFGHEVHTAHDGMQALGEAARIKPHMVILDIGLPSMDGYEVAQRLRADKRLAPMVLVALTGYAQERDRLNAHEAGFDHHFAKPLDIGKLTAVLNGMN